MGVVNTIRRRFDVPPAYGHNMEAPNGLILFKHTSVAESEIKSNRVRIGISLSLTLIFAVCIAYSIIFVAPMLITASITFLFFRTYQTFKNTPLAVNLNHPFMETGAIGDSELMVKFEDKWIHPGINRLMMSKDPALGILIHRQDEDLSILGSWPKYVEKQLILINQAISLNNAINDSNDEFEDAREREEQESGLLEREWLPEEEIEVEGPISRIFTGE